MNRYPAYKNTGFDWLGEIPSHWRVKALKRVLDEPLKYGATEAGLETDPEWPRYIRITDFDQDGKLRADTFVSLPEEVARDFYLAEGDILFARSGATVGKTFLFQNYVGRACFAGYLIRASTARNQLTPEFLYYFTKSLAYEAWKDFIFTQATIQNIGADKYAYLSVCLPPKQEQEQIIAYLKLSYAGIDTALNLKKRQLEVIDAFRATTIQRAVTQGIDERPQLVATGNVWLQKIPKEWALVALKRVCEIQTGLTLGKEYEGSLVERPYLRVANVQDGHLDLEDIATIEVPPSVAERVELRSGDVLMTEGGDLDKLGRGYLWNGEITGCLHQNHIFAVRCFAHKLLPKFLTYLTASRYGRDYFEATGKRTTNLASTNSTKVGLFPLPLPKLTEQERILEYLDEQLLKIHAIQTTLQRQIDALLAYRKSLTHECVTGQRQITEVDLRPIQVHA